MPTQTQPESPLSHETVTELDVLLGTVRRTIETWLVTYEERVIETLKLRAALEASEQLDDLIDECDKIELPTRMGSTGPMDVGILEEPCDRSPEEVREILQNCSLDELRVHAFDSFQVVIPSCLTREETLDLIVTVASRQTKQPPKENPNA